eukprot:7654081-Pyramimonas_sp.AAC.1
MYYPTPPSAASYRAANSVEAATAPSGAVSVPVKRTPPTNQPTKVGVKGFGGGGALLPASRGLRDVLL